MFLEHLAPFSAPAQRDSVAALKAELGWAGHLGLQAVLLPQPPQPMNSAHYAQIISQVRERRHKERRGVCGCVCV